VLTVSPDREKFRRMGKKSRKSKFFKAKGSWVIFETFWTIANPSLATLLLHELGSIL
jgi:hypothetical protein